MRVKNLNFFTFLYRDIGIYFIIKIKCYRFVDFCLLTGFTFMKKNVFDFNNICKCDLFSNTWNIKTIRLNRLLCICVCRNMILFEIF